MRDTYSRYIYPCIVFAIFLTSVIIVLEKNDISQSIVSIIVLSVFAALAESLPVATGGRAISVSSAISICALLSYGPLAAVLISIVSVLLRIMKNPETGKYIHVFNTSFHKSVLNIAIIGTSSILSSSAFWNLSGRFLPFSTITPHQITIEEAFTTISSLSPYILVAIFIEMFVNTLLIAGYAHISGRGQLLREWIHDFFWSFAGLLVVGLMGVVLTAFYLSYGWFMILVFFAPLFLARYTFSLYSNLRVSYMDTVKSLSDAIEAKDHYTRGHSQRVQEYSALIADELKYTPKQKEILQYAALLHDVGKIGVTETILNKPGKLDELEFDSIKQHPEMGARIISNVKYLKECVPIIKYHHKYYDGSGYPDITKDEKIPYESYILGVADAFDAMTSKRQYREPYTLDRAIEEIRRCSGTQFEPSVAEAFINAFTKQQAKANAQTLPTRRKRRGSSGAVPVVIPAAKDAGKALEPMDSLDSVQS